MAPANQRQLVAFVDLHLSNVDFPGATVDGLAVTVTVGALVACAGIDVVIKANVATHAPVISLKQIINTPRSSSAPLVDSGR